MKFKIMMIALLSLAILGVTGAAAYYAAEIESQEFIKIADVSFSLGDGAIEMDFSDPDRRIEPLRTGDHFDISFRTTYTGDVEGIVVPHLKVKAENFVPGDVIIVTDGTNAESLKNAEADLFSDPRKVQPGETIECVYRITISEHDGEEPLLFDYDFGIAATQAAHNEKLLDGSMTNQEVYEEIMKKHAGESSDTAGFTDYIGTDQSDEPIVRYNYPVELIPSILNGNGSDYQISWYVCLPGTEEKKVHEGSERSRLFTLSDAHEGMQIRYEVRNEAGITASGYVVLHMSKGEFSFEEKDYVPDYSET